MSILEPTEQELEFQKKLRDVAIKEMKAEYSNVNYQTFDNLSLAKKLGLLPTGVTILMEKDSWTIETGIRVCVALGLTVTMNVEKDWKGM